MSKKYKAHKKAKRKAERDKGKHNPLKAKWLIISGMVALLLTSIFVYLASTNEDATTEDTTEEEYVSTVEYTHVDEDTIYTMPEDAYFVEVYSASCPACQEAVQVVDEYATSEGALPVYKLSVDTPEGQALADEIGITGLPTMLYIENGEIVNRTDGGIPDVTAITNLLPADDVNEDPATGPEVPTQYPE